MPLRGKPYRQRALVAYRSAPRRLISPLDPIRSGQKETGTAVSSRPKGVRGAS
jgi:hypothetical protein